MSQTIADKPTNHVATLIAVGLKLLKSTKVVKVALFGASAASYAWLWTWETAAVLLYALFIHELGHVKAMRWMGLPTKGMYFLPFLGAVAVGQVSRTRFEEAFIALMGPVFGVLSLGPLVVWASLGDDSSWWGYVGLAALLNVFNLLPLGFLDGGRVVHAITHSIGNRVGLVVFMLTLITGGLLVAASGSVTLGFILGVSAIEYVRDRRRPGPEIPAMSRKELVTMGLAYALAFALFLAVIDAAGGHEGGDLARLIVND